MKFRDAIEEEQRVLNKLKLGEELSEKLIDRFMNSTEARPTHQTGGDNLLLPVIDTSLVDTKKSAFPSLYSTTDLISGDEAVKREPKINIAYSP